MNYLNYKIGVLMRLSAILLIPFLISNVNAQTQQDLQISTVECPGKLQVGERGIFIITITNLNKKNVDITKMDFIPDNISNNESTIIPISNNSFPMQLQSYSSFEVENKFSSVKEGIHYIDLNLNYLSNGDQSHKIYSINQELCKVEVSAPEQNPLWQDILIGGGVSSLVAGFVIYLVKRPFEKKDFEHQQETQHKMWLSQQIHALAEKYYFPLAKFGEEARRTISIASSSEETRDIKMAYYQLAIFLKKYNEFERDVGANYLFKDRGFEQIAINKFQAITVSLPLDKKDINAIVNDIHKKEKTYEDISYRTSTYKYFEQWLKSEFCKKSRDQVMIKLNDFTKILDKQGERISQPDYFSKPPEEPENQVAGDSFWITFSSSKYVPPNGRIFVSGNGFDDSNKDYKFYLGGKTLEKGTTYNNMIELKIPNDMKKGTYDLYAQFSGNKETIGIVIHIY